jgi:DNA-directed RNA polymerase II subunit RPB2
VSDSYRVHVCTKCGFMAIANMKNNEYTCEYCKDKYGGGEVNVVQVTIPYACKLLFQELTAMQISIKFVTDVK